MTDRHRTDKIKDLKKLSGKTKSKPAADLPKFTEILNDKDLAFCIEQLSADQRAFADKFRTTRDAVNSYMEVYKCSAASAHSNAYRTLNLPYVLAYVNYHWKKGYFQGTMNQAQLVGIMTNVIERCMQVDPVLDAEGNQTGQFTFRAQAVVQAARLLKDLLGLGADNKKQDNSNFLVRIFCVPTFGNSIIVPEDNKADITKFIESKIIEKKS